MRGDVALYKDLSKKVISRKNYMYVSKAHRFITSKTSQDLAIISALGLIPLTWFRCGRLILGVDFSFPLDATAIINQLIYLWNPVLGGDYTIEVPKLFPTHILIFMLTSLGLPLNYAERVWFIWLFLFPGFSFYYLMRAVETSVQSRLARLVASIFYMFSFYVLLQWHNGSDTSITAYGALPLMAGLLIKAFGCKSKQLRYTILIAFASLSFTLSASYPPIYIITWLVSIVLGLCLNLDTLKSQQSVALKVFLYVIAFSLLLNLWWLLPMLNWFTAIQYTMYTLTYVESCGLTRIDWIMSHLIPLNARHSSILNVIRLQGFWGFYEGTERGPYFSYSPTYNHIPLSIMGFAFPLLVFVALLRCPRNKTVLTFSILAIISIFLVKSVHPPLDILNRIMYEHIPGFWIFASNYIVFGPLLVLSYTVLTAVSLDVLLRSKMCKRKTLKGIIVASSIFLIIGYSYPLVTGPFEEFFHVNVPQYYQDAYNWLNTQEGDFKIFLLPIRSAGMYEHYAWGYNGPEIHRYWSEKSLLVGGGILQYQPMSEIFEQMMKAVIQIDDGPSSEWTIYSSHHITSSNFTNDGDLLKYIIVTDGRGYETRKKDIDEPLSTSIYKYVIFRGRVGITNTTLSLTVRATDGTEWSGSITSVNWDIQTITLAPEKTLEWVRIDADSYPTTASGEYSFYIDYIFLSSSKDISQTSVKQIGNVLGLMSVKYILLDHSYLGAGSGVPEFLERRLAESQGIFKVAQFGSLDIYEVQNNLPRIYLTTNVVLINGTIEDFTRQVMYQGSNFDNKVLVLSEQIEPTLKEQLARLISTKDEKPEIIEFVKASPVKYILRVSSNTDFILVLNEPYFPGWIITINGLEIGNHFIANGAMNAWYINDRGMLIVEVRYKPSTLLHIGGLISLASALSLIICLIIMCWKATSKG